MNAEKTPLRYHGFDLLRSVAMLLGIVIHAPIVYADRVVAQEVVPMVTNLPELEDWIGVILLWIHCWRMPTFFLIAGFMSILVIERTSTTFFLRDRILRVACPMVLFGFLLIGYPSNNHFAIGHFWFLYCLIAIIGIFVLSSFLIPVLSIQRIKPVVTWPFLKPSHLLSLLAIFILVRLLCSFPYNGNLPIPEVYSKFFVGTFIYYCFWFYAGIGLFLARSEMMRFTNFKFISLVGLLSTFSMIVTAFVIDTYDFFVTPETLNENSTPTFFLMNMYWASTTFLWTFFLTFLFQRLLNRRSAFVRWLVELSYPTYIFHLTLAIVISGELIKSGFNQSEVFLMTIPLTFGSCLICYYIFVKFTPLNWIVNGYKKSWFKIPKLFGSLS
mgnify:FL=1